MADRVVLLRGGRIEQVGSPEELYARPATAFTASFIGAPPMNLMKLNGSGILTGVRPEDIRLEAEGGRREGALEATVESVEYLGADSLIAARGGFGSIIVRVPGHSGVRTGESVRIGWDKSSEHHFDETTGGRRP